MAIQVSIVCQRLGGQLSQDDFTVRNPLGETENDEIYGKSTLVLPDQLG
jgi:hypothetical protein